MRAACWLGKGHVEVQEVPDPEIVNPHDAIVRITSTAICGSDLHLYNGFVPTMQRGDVLVLCSDGLSGQVRTNEIAEIVNTEPDLVQVCKKLIDRANEAGGPDNITVVAVRFDGPGLTG